MGIATLIQKIKTGSNEESCGLRSGNYSTVGLTPGLIELKVKHDGKAVSLTRNQDPKARINPLYAKISRPCPPFCIQPMQLAPDVDTIGELEMFDYIKLVSDGDESMLIIDSRITSWADKGTIPGSINIPWTSLITTQGASLRDIVDTLEYKFSVKLHQGKNYSDVAEALIKKEPQTVFDFSQAKTLVLFCNGAWCSQSTESIEALLNMGYPAEKLKYYRDGMQGWESLGLTTVKS